MYLRKKLPKICMVVDIDTVSSLVVQLLIVVVVVVVVGRHGGPIG